MVQGPGLPELQRGCRNLPTEDPELLLSPGRAGKTTGLFFIKSPLKSSKALVQSDIQVTDLPLSLVEQGTFSNLPQRICTRVVVCHLSLPHAHPFLTSVSHADQTNQQNTTITVPLKTCLNVI